MLNIQDILETIRMIKEENLDIRTVTMGISLFDCISDDSERLEKKIYDKITTSAKNLVSVCCELEKTYGIPIVNKRISVTPISYVGSGLSPDGFVRLAKVLERAASELGVNFIGGFSAHVQKGETVGARNLIEAIPEAMASTSRICSSINVATTKAGINMDAVAKMGEIINSRYKKNPRKFIDRLRQMGVEDKYDILSGARGPKIKTPDDKGWSLMDLVSMSYGYVIETTPLNMVTFYNTVANGGKQMKPRLVKRVMKEGNTIVEFEPEVLREKALSEQTVKDLQMILYEVVNDKNGTGKWVKSDKFPIAGKTGTARRVKPGFGYNYSPMRYLLSFCGYFPANAPKYTCIVQIIKSGPGGGGTTSGLVFKEIAERVMAKNLRVGIEAATDTLNPHTPIIKHGNLGAVSYLLGKLDIDTDNDVDDSEDEKIWGKITNENGKLGFAPKETNKSKVPDVKGMGAKDAIYLLKQAGLRVGLSGYGRVVAQSISAGQTAQKGAYIQITLKP